MKDKIFSEEITKIEDFTFNEGVVAVFDDMVGRSVPYYSEFQRMSVQLVKHFLQPGKSVFDLGCSTGTTIVKLMDTLDASKDARFVGIDSSQAMLDKAREKIRELKYDESKVELRCQRLEELDTLNNAGAVIALFIFQFLRPLQREQLLAKVVDSLPVGGCLLLGEKILPDDQLFRRCFVDFYHDLKRQNGYSSREIQQKREALENVLIPFKEEENRDLLMQVGFSKLDVAFKWYNFALFVAVK